MVLFRPTCVLVLLALVTGLQKPITEEVNDIADPDEQVPEEVLEAEEELEKEEGPIVEEAEEAGKEASKSTMISKEHLKKRASEMKGKGCIQVMNNRNDGSGFTSDLTIGDVVQRALLDTGSFETVVESKECMACKGATYSSRHSATFRDTAGKIAQPTAGEAYGDWVKTFSPKNTFWGSWRRFWAKSMANIGRYQRAGRNLQVLMYGSGPVMADPGTDDVSLPGCEHLFGEEFPILEVVDHQIPILMMNDLLTSIVGMGPGPAEESNKRLHHLLGVDRFQFCMPKSVDSEGAVLWDGPEPGVHDKAKQLDMAGLKHWGVKVQDMKLVNNKNDVHDVVGCQNGCGAILDTGTSLLAPEPATVRAIKEKWAAIDDCSRFRELPSLHFMLGGVPHTLPPETYVAIVVPCLVSMSGMDCQEPPVNDENVDKNIVKTKVPVTRRQWPVTGLNRKPLRDPSKIYEHLSPSDRAQLELHATMPINLAASNSSNMREPTTQCDLLLMDMDMGETQVGPMMILGIPFFRYYTTTFDVVGEQDDVRRLDAGESPATIFTEGDDAPVKRKVFTKRAGADCSEEKIMKRESMKGKKGAKLFEGAEEEEHTSRTLHMYHESAFRSLLDKDEQRLVIHKNYVAKHGF